MSISLRSVVRGSIFPAVMGLCFTGLISSAPAQNPNDLLLKSKAEQDILTQKIDSKMREAVKEAQRLQGTSKVRAANALKTALNQLDDPLVPASFRSAWTAQIQAQIKAIDSGKPIADPNEINPIKREIKEADRQRAKAIEDEYYDVKRTIDTITSLNKSGNAIQAQKEAAALAKRYPNNPATLVLGENLGMNQRIADARLLVAQQQQGYIVAMRSVDKSAIPPKDDIEFDAKRFQEITKLRVKPLLTKKEDAILKALDTSVNLGFKDAPFNEVITAISTATGQNILLDKSALEEAMIQSNTPTSITARGITARSALRKVLQDQGLTFIIKDESIQVVTLARAREMLVTRVYYLGDLVRVNGPFGGAVNWGPWMDMMQTQDNVAKIIEMVKAIDPNSWQGAGGNGTVTFNWPSMALVVRQTAEVHARLSGLAR